MSGRRMKKGTMIVLILFIYMLGMGIWGYNKGTVDGVEVICYIVGMSVLLAILLFLYNKKDKYKNDRNKDLKKQKSFL